MIPALLLELGQKKAELHWQQAKQTCVCACDKTQNPAKLNEEVAKLKCGLFLCTTCNTGKCVFDVMRKTKCGKERAR